MAYLMEHDGESERIERKTDIEWTTRLLAGTGLVSGLRALDVGCASGSTTRAMARLTEPSLVTGLDLSAERLSYARRQAEAHGQPIRYAEGNALEMPFDEGEFDYAWARFVFEYLKEPERALKEMIRVTAPGGLVVVGDLDGNCIYHYPLPAELEAQMNAVMKAAATVGFDPWVGRKLYTFFYDAGLKDIQVQLHGYHCFAGPIPEADQENWWAKLKVLAPVGAHALGSKEAYARFSDEMKAFLLREDTFTYSTLLLVRGRKGE